MKPDAPSDTANVVARNIAVVAANPATAALVAPETARLNAMFVQAFSARGARFLKRTEKRWFQTLFSIYERLTVPGLALHQALRKLHIERAVRAALAEGFEQVVVLGGGFDALCWRLHREFPEKRFLELDHPATGRIKRETIEKLDERRGANLNFLAADFTNQTLTESLDHCSHFEREAKTIFICEGVLMYLVEEEIERLFAFVKTHQKPCRFVFTFMEPDERGRAAFRRSTFLVRLWLRWKKEPFLWSLNRECLESFLAARGFALKEIASPQFFRQNYLKQLPSSDFLIAEGENVCVCEVKEL
jgi:methyltransferase (TIGR00027 family)